MIETPVPYIEPLCTPQKVGDSLSIRQTILVAVPVFPARSEKINVNVQLPVKRCQVEFIPVSVSEYPVNVAKMLLLVRVQDIGLYSMVAVGGFLSIRVTIAVALPVFPARSEKLNVNVQFHVKVCQVKFIPVSGSEYPVNVDKMSLLVRVQDIGLYIMVAVGGV